MIWGKPYGWHDQWRSVFAWTPVQLDTGQYVWLQKVERLKSYSWEAWNYRLPQKEERNAN